MNTLSIRAAVREDAESVLALWNAADAEPTSTDTLSAVTQLITDFPGTLLVAELECRLAGTIVAGWDGWRGSLYRLAVLPQDRRRGIARALVAAGIRELRRRGAVRLSALVVESDQNALAFWSSITDLGLVPDPKPKCRYVATLSTGD